MYIQYLHFKASQWSLYPLNASIWFFFLYSPSLHGGSLSSSLCFRAICPSPPGVSLTLIHLLPLKPSQCVTSLPSPPVPSFTAVLWFLRVVTVACLTPVQKAAPESRAAGQTSGFGSVSIYICFFSSYHIWTAKPTALNVNIVVNIQENTFTANRWHLALALEKYSYDTVALTREKQTNKQALEGFDCTSFAYILYIHWLKSLVTTSNIKTSPKSQARLYKWQLSVHKSVNWFSLSPHEVKCALL